MSKTEREAIEGATESFKALAKAFAVLGAACLRVVPTVEAFSAKIAEMVEAMELRQMVPPDHIRIGWLKWLGFKEVTLAWESPFFGVITYADLLERWR